MVRVGSADEVTAEVGRVIDILGEGGGFVLNSVHNIQNDIPIANIIAMFDAGRNHARAGHGRG